MASSHQCTGCRKEFKCEQRMREHMKLRCPASECVTYTCNLCSQVFRTQSAIRMHRKYKHDARQFKCLACGKHFPTIFTLRTHIRMHTSERPHSCTKCGREYTTLARLKSHICRKHSNDLEASCIHTCMETVRNVSEFIDANVVTIANVADQRPEHA